MDKTLYVSDLDGTLLRSDERTSSFTNDVINTLTSRGMVFSYATARSFNTARKVTQGLDAKIPLIVYNGVSIIDNVTGELLLTNYFDDSVYGLLRRLEEAGISPIVYAHIDGRECFTYVPGLVSPGAMTFINSRQGDPRMNPVSTTSELALGRIFYITCIDEPYKLLPVLQEYEDTYRLFYQKDIYTGDQWLEIIPRECSKSNAILKLKELYGCSRIVVFGDGKNDIDMFELADESYAVENAHEDLKKVATGIIASNDEDGVAKWLLGRVGVSLEKATTDDIEDVWKMQVEAFEGLYEKYRDDDTSPARDPMSRVTERFAQEGSVYYYIVAKGERVGVIRVVDKKDGSRKRISPLWIMPEYRGKGYAQMAILAAEAIYGSDNWSLDTILQEKGNIHLYEKMGYHRVGESEKINERMDIVFYEKD